MAASHDSKPSSDRLRRQAEERSGSERLTTEIEALTPDAARQMLHELRVHQIELEMQNDELRRTQVELDTARARYFDLYDLAPVGYLTMGEDRRIIESNLAFARLLGIPKSEVIPRPFTDFIHPEDQDCWYRHWRLLAGTAGPLSCELRLLRVDATPLWVRIETAEVNDGEGGPGYRAVLVDISDRKRAEHDRLLFEAAARQQQKLEALGTLASGVAHEINNPLNVIMNYCQLLADEPPDPDRTKEYVGNIHRESERVAVIVRSLLGFARHGEVQFEEAPLGRLVEETLSLARLLLQKSRIDIVCEIPADLPSVRCRPQLVQQVLVNLLTNARDALNDRFPDVSAEKVVRVEASSFVQDGARWVRVSVEDHGCGIRPDVVPRVFDPFFTTKGRARGTGLGLSISHDIALEHQGRIWFETEPCRGTTFHLDLPVGDGDASP